MLRPETPRASFMKLPVWETNRKAYQLVFNGLGHLGTAAFVPFCLNLLIAALIQIGSAHNLLSLLLLFLDAVPATIFAVSWHRLVLLGPLNAPPRLLPNWSGYHWRFLSYALVVGYLVLGVSVLAMIGLGMIVVASDAPAVFVLLVVVFGLPCAFYPSLRLSLVLPAAAVGVWVGLEDSWRYTRGEGWRFVWVTLMAFLPLFAFGLINVLAARADGSSAMGAQDMAIITNIWLLDRVIWAIPSYLSIALTVTVLSLAFRHRTEWKPPSEADDRGPVSET